jgi:Uma2 family endonuclease
MAKETLVKEGLRRPDARSGFGWTAFSERFDSKRGACWRARQRCVARVFEGAQKQKGSAMPLSKKKEHYTYADYVTWPEDVRCELIEGEAIPRESAPSDQHQRIVRLLFLEMGLFLEGKPYELFSAPFDVRLNADGADDTVVQPDLALICDPAKVSFEGCSGAPDMIAEILSSSTDALVRVQKYNQYQKYGVCEYWIVDPRAKSVEVHILDSHGQYAKSVYGEADAIDVNLLDGCKIDLKRLFSEKK